MFNLLGKPLIEYLSDPLIIIGLILLAIGFATVILARRITRVARQSNEIENNDTIFVTIRVIGIIVLVVGFCLCGWFVIDYIISKK